MPHWRIGAVMLPWRVTSEQFNTRFTTPDWRIAAAAVLSSGIAATIGQLTGVGTLEQAVLIARYTARVSLGLFVIVYVLGPGARTWLLPFVLTHLIHFATMIHLFVTTGAGLRPHELIFGCLAYAAPVAALLVPGDPRAFWRRLALDYVWLAFVVTYYHRLFEFPERRAAGTFAFALLLVALAMRVLVVARRR